MKTRTLSLKQLSTLLQFLPLLLLFCSSCGPITGNEQVRSTNEINVKSNALAEDAPNATVVQFMDFISKNDLDSARGFLGVRPRVVEQSNVMQEAPAQLDWALVFQEQDLVFDRITNTEISGNEAVVRTILKMRDDPAFDFVWNFTVLKIDDRWMIVNIGLDDIEKRSDLSS